jgi:Bacterial Ig domain
MRKLYTLPLSPASLRDAARLHILGILFFFSVGSAFGQNKPIANDDRLNIYYASNKMVRLDLAQNDVLPSSGSVSFKIVKQPKYVRVFLDQTKGTFTYSMTYLFESLDTFEYAIHEPVRNVYDTATVILQHYRGWSYGTDLNVNSDNVQTGIKSYYLNESIFNADTLANYQVDILEMPKKGTVRRLSAQMFEYISNDNVEGFDSLTYRACDRSFNYCKDFKINIKLKNKPPVANDDSITVKYNTEEYFNYWVQKNDYDVDDDIESYKILGTKTNSTAVFENFADLTYIPELNFTGQDIITYQVCDKSGFCDTAKIYVTVLPPDALNAYNVRIGFDVVENLSDVDNLTGYVTPSDQIGLTFRIIKQAKQGSITLLNEEVSYNLVNRNFLGRDTAKYSVCTQDGRCDTALIIIDVFSTNSAPYANDDYFATGGETIEDNVSQNDYDDDDNIVSFKLLKNPKLGTINFDIQGYFLYSPLPNKLGTDTLTYQVCDQMGLCDTAKLFIDVTPNVAPVAKDDYLTTYGEEIYESIVQNDTDNNFDSFNLLNTAKLGEAYLDSDGYLNYTPSSNVFGNDTLTYRVCDVGGLCDTANIFINIINSNLAPIAYDDNYETSGEVINDNVSINDDYLDGDINDYRLLTNAKLGQIEFASTGEFFYTPKANIVGIDTISYQVCDEFNLCDTANIYVSVNTQIDSTNTPSVSIQSSTSNACMGANIDFVATVTGITGIVNYQWEESADGTNFIAIAGANSAVLIASTYNVGLTFYHK